MHWRLASSCRFWTVLFYLVAVLAGGADSIIVASATASLRPPLRPARPLNLFGPGNVLAPNSEIASNESAVIDLCRDYFDAELEYLRLNPNGERVPVFAQRIRSTPGKRDGLYWPIGKDEDESPVGPKLAAAAITEQQAPEKPRPFSGYYVKTLLAQGPAAIGGARDYRVAGRLRTGFALVAWPAEYGVSGIQSFVVNHLGDVYARDLGPDTSRIAARLSTFNPDAKWTKVASAEDDE